MTNSPFSLRAQAQEIFDEYNDNELCKSDFFRRIDAVHGVASHMYVQTNNQDYWVLCCDLQGLIYDVRQL